MLPNNARRGPQGKVSRSNDAFAMEKSRELRSKNANRSLAFTFQMPDRFTEDNIAAHRESHDDAHATQSKTRYLFRTTTTQHGGVRITKRANQSAVYCILKPSFSQPWRAARNLSSIKTKRYMFQKIHSELWD